MKKKLIKEKLKPFSDINSLRKMKLIVFFIAIVVCQLSATHSYAQKTKITLRLNNVSLKEALKSIEEQTEFVFFYNNDKFDLNQKVSFDVRNGTIIDLLDQISDKYSYMTLNPQPRVTKKKTKR
jgi:hypothetical protein